MFDRPAKVAEPDQLAASNDSMLAHGQLDDHAVASSPLCVHQVHKGEPESIRPPKEACPDPSFSCGRW
jgi:hypothetical protein